MYYHGNNELIYCFVFKVEAMYLDLLSLDTVKEFSSKYTSSGRS